MYFHISTDQMLIDFRGEYEIAEGTTAAVFNAVLDYYHTGVIHCPPHVPVLDLRDACDYFLLPFNAATVKCQVNESIDLYPSLY